MKKVLFLIFLLPIALLTFAQKQFNESQLNLRSNIEMFLREEGFMPTLDKDGDIQFKKEGETYYVIVNSNDTSPFYVTISKYYNYGGNYTRQNISKNLETFNLKKAVKVLLYEKTYVYQAEMYTVNAEYFKYVFYKLMKQLDALQDEVKEICSNQNSTTTERTSIQGNNGTLLVDEDFSSHSSLWKSSKGKVSYKNGKMIFKDTEGSGFSNITYALPYDLKNKDFQLSFSMKADFEEKYSSSYFILGSKWNDAYWFGLCDWGQNKIILCYGNYDDSKKYYGYSGNSNLSINTTHEYTMIKKGRKVEWYADGKFLFSATIDLSTDMKLIGFLVPNHHTIEVDSLTIKLI